MSSEVTQTPAKNDDTKSHPPKEPEFVRPPINLYQDLKDGINYLLFDPNAALLVGPILLLMESAALKVIIKKVAYTEIDYSAYMEQIEMIKCEHNYNYTEIRGGTGPLVYPAGHVSIFKAMYWLSNGMENIGNVQIIFRYLYLMTLLLQMICYDMLQLPPWCMILACLSKRLHSIYVLRLFNDCFTTLFMVFTMTLLFLNAKIKSNKGKFILLLFTSLSYSIGVSIKMNALLYLPAMIISIFILSGKNVFTCILNGIVMIMWQLYIALPFLQKYPWEYLHGAFNFKRQFMFEWSINWQFLDEETFHDEIFQKSLLISQIILIMTIILMEYPNIFQDIWYSLTFRNDKQLEEKQEEEGMKDESQETIQLIGFLLVMCNFIGIMFSRSLHYQFLSWYHWTIPIMMKLSGLPIYIGIIWYLLYEYCWNSYPPNSKASLLLFGCNIFLIACIFINQSRNREVSSSSSKITKETDLQEKKSK